MKAEYKHFYRSRDAPFLLPTDILQGSRQTKGSQFKMDVSKELSTRIEQIVNKDGSHLKATASVTIGGAFAIHGIRIMDSEKGLFVQMPQRSFKREGGKTEYHDVFHPVTAEARAAIIKSVMAAYTAKVKEQSRQTPGEKEKNAGAASVRRAHKQSPER